MFHMVLCARAQVIFILLFHWVAELVLEKCQRYDAASAESKWTTVQITAATRKHISLSTRTTLT